MFSRASRMAAWGVPLLVALSGTAHAQLTAQAFATVAGGATNNALMAPDADPAQIASDVFTTIRAGAQGQYIGRSADQILAYTYSGTFFANHPEADIENMDLGWRLHATPTGRTDLRANADATYTHLSAADPLAAVGAVNPQSIPNVNALPIPAGDASYFGLGVAALGTYQLSGNFGSSARTALAEILPESGGNIPRSFTVTQSFHFEHPWGLNAFTTDLILNYIDASALTRADGTVAPANQSVSGDLMAGWKHEFSAYLVGALAAGALVANLDGDTTIQPIGQATVRYTRGIALAVATLGQGSQIDPYLGQILLNDTLSVTTFLSLDRLERFHFVAYGSAQHGSVVTNGTLSGAGNLLVGDVGISFRPLQYALVAALDYNILDQIGDQTGNPTGNVFPSLHRQMVFLSLTAFWRSDTGIR